MDWTVKKEASVNRGESVSARVKPSYGIIVLTVRDEPYIHFDRIKHSYYRSRGVRFVDVLNEPELRATETHEMLYVSDCWHPSGIPVMLEKFQWALRALLADPSWNDVDYFVRTNSSTFVNIEEFELELDRLPRRRCYAGSIVDRRFISGTCIIISRDVAEWFSRAKISGYLNCHDDIGISRMMRRRLVGMRELPMAMFVRDDPGQLGELEEALRKYPLVRVRNNADRELFDKSIWNRIAEIKGITGWERDVIGITASEKERRI